MSHRPPATKFIFLTLLLDVLGFGLIIPVAPRLVQQLQGGSEDAAATTVGLLAASYAAMQFLFSPILGALSDRFGRRSVLLVSLFGSGLDYIALALSPTIAFLFITRAINGISGASMTVASAYIADVTPPEKRAGAFGMMGAAFGIGFILGPLMGGYLGDINIHYPFYAAAALTFLNWMYGFIVLPESLPVERRAPFKISRANPIGAFAGLGRYPLVAGIAIATFFANLAQFGLHATWVLYTGHRYGWTPKQVGLSLAVVGIGAAIVQGGLARKIIPWLGEKNSILLGLLIAIAAYIGYGAVTQGWMIYVVIAYATLGGIAMPAAQTLITRTVLPTEQGATQGALTGLQSLANILGPIIGSITFRYSILPASPVHIDGLTFFVGAGMAAIGWVIAAYTLARWHTPKVVS
ncbi:MAG: TCR/Tet family MFS transporter [Planctomycetota bacterium]|nr:TCR/Tet family MFS transporter [Planctomycetota bacterium]